MQYLLANVLMLIQNKLYFVFCILYYVIYYEMFRNVMQRTENEALKKGSMHHYSGWKEEISSRF